MFYVDVMDLDGDISKSGNELEISVENTGDSNESGYVETVHGGHIIDSRRLADPDAPSKWNPDHFDLEPGDVLKFHVPFRGVGEYRVVVGRETVATLKI